nr:MAG TPA: hypothetical protein [Caudoviricetes sp.]
MSKSILNLGRTDISSKRLQSAKTLLNITA